MARSNIGYKYFNQCVVDLVNDLANVYPSDMYLSLIRTGLPLYIRNNETGLQEAFSKGCSKYHDQLLAKDETFFLEKDASEWKKDYKELRDSSEFSDFTTAGRSMSGMGGGGSNNGSKNKENSNFAQLVNRIKAHWEGMDEDNKTVVWEYVHALIKYSDMCA
jgi:hypothetical protein